MGKHILFFLLLLSHLPIKAQSKVWTLKKCIEQALQKNISVTQSQLSNEINKLTLEQSKKNRFPSLNASGNQAYSFGRSIDPFSNQFVNQNIRSNNFSLNSGITLFNGLQTTNTINQNELNYEAGNLDIEKVKNDIMLSVATAYLQTLFAYEQQDNARRQLEATILQVERTQKLLDAGSVPESNLFQIKAELASEKLTLVNAENMLTISKLTLLQLMELPIDSSFEIEKPLFKEPLFETIPSQEEVYNTALGTQPQIKSAALKSNSAMMEIKIAKALQMPRLVLSGSLNTGYSSARNLISYQTQYNTQNIGYLQSNPSEVVSSLVPVTTTLKENYPFAKQFKDNFSQSLGLNLTVPIFNNGQVKTSIEKAKINVMNAQLDEQNTKNQLRKSVEQATTDLNAAIKKYEAVKEQATALELSYRNSEKKYGLGMINAIDFLIEKNNYIQARSDLLQAKYDSIFKMKVLDFYMGKPLTF